MEEKKKKQEKKADFAKEDNSFGGGAAKKSTTAHKKEKNKHSKAYQPRDADRAEEPKNEKKQPQNEEKPPQNEEKEEDTRDEGGEYHKRDTYHRSDEKKTAHKKRIHREYQSRERTKETFQKETFAGNGAKDRSGGSGSEFKGSKKLRRMDRDVNRARDRTAKARRKTQVKEYHLQRVFDEKTGKTRYVLAPAFKTKTDNHSQKMKRMYYRAEGEVRNFVHGKVSEHEKDNVGLEAAHKVERKAEDVVMHFARNRKSRLQKNKDKLRKLEKKQFRKEVNFNYQKFLEENPEMKGKSLKKAMQRKFQKKRIQREYAKAARTAKTGAGTASKQAKEAAREASNLTTVIAKKAQELAAKYGSVVAVVGLVGIMLVIIMTSISSCGAMFSNGASTVMGGSYQSVPAEIDSVALKMTEYEAALRLEINNIETDYPDYDEYNYDLDGIGHNPFTLISYLSAKHTTFTATDVQAELEELFDAMYELTLDPTEETRTRTVTKTGTRTVTDPETGLETEEEYEYEEEEEYTVTILNVKLSVTPLETVVYDRMTDDQKSLYAVLNETKGLTQVFYNPLGLCWYNYISSGYGYKVDPTTGAVVFNRGVDIAVAEGMNVYAAMDGTITEVAYDDYFGNYIVIENANGYCTKYAYLASTNVRVGQTVTHGSPIGTTGASGSSTGSGLHIECLYNGEYYNPLFYFEA